MNQVVNDGSVITQEMLEEIVKVFEPVPDANKMFKDFVASKMDVPDDAVYIVPKDLFEYHLTPDPDIFCDEHAPQDMMYVMSREYIDNPFKYIPIIPLDLSKL